LLDVLDFIFGLFEVDDLDGHDLGTTTMVLANLSLI
jgi:hypothetical protein